MERQRDTNMDSAYTQQLLLYIECISTSVLSFLMALNDCMVFTDLQVC